jgi:subtilisin family serine protease
MIPGNTYGVSAITVAASNQYDQVAYYSGGGVSSNTGPCVDLFAPGGPFLSAQALNGDGSAGSAVDSTGSWEGTSSAAPHVAAAAAMAWHKYTTGVTASTIEYHIKENATPGLITGDPRSDTPNLLLHQFWAPGRRRACCVWP